MLINFFRKNYKIITKFSFGLFILYYLIFFLTPKVKMSANQKQQLDSLNLVIQTLHEDNVNLEYRISDFYNQINQVDENISKIKNQKTIIREYYHEKVNNVDKLTVSEIDSFFANRYK